MALYAVGAVTLCVSVAIAFLAYSIYRDVRYLVGRQKLYDEWATADRALQEQRKAPLHKLSPPQLVLNKRDQPTGMWGMSCSCGWSYVASEASEALDEAERHKAQMPQRRAV